jgi:WD40 repeat protein
LQATIAGQQAATATAAQGIAQTKSQQSLSLALVNAVDEALSFTDNDLALALAVRAVTTDLNSVLAHRKLLQVAYAPGTKLVFGLADGIKLDAVISIIYSEGGATAVSTSRDGRALLWDTATGKLIREFGSDGNGHLGGINTAAFSLDGKQLITGGDDGDLIVWDVETGAQVKRFGKSTGSDTGAIRGVGFRTDGRVISSNAANLVLWDPKTGRLMRQVDFLADRGGNVSISSNRLLTLIGRKAWSNTSFQTQRPFKAGWIGAISPDNQQVVSSFDAEATSVFIANIATGEVVRQLDQSDGVLGPITAVAFSPDNRLVAAGTRDGSLILWEADTGIVLSRYFGHNLASLTSVAFSPDSRSILSGADDGQIRLWEVNRGGEVTNFFLNYGVTDMIYSPDGTRLLTPHIDQSLRLIDAATGQELKRLYGHQNFVSSLAYSLDGKLIASGDASGTIILWDAAKGQQIRPLAGHNNTAFMAFSPDSTRLFSGSSDPQLNVTLRVWDVARGRTLFSFTSDVGPVLGVAYSPDGKTLLSIYKDFLILWDAATGKELRRLETSGNGNVLWQGSNIQRQTQRINAAYSPDGQTVIYAQRNEVLLWEVNTGRTRQLGGDGETHLSLVSDVAFGPDGSIAVSLAVGDIRLWDIASGRLLYVYGWQAFSDGAWAQRLAFRSDGLVFSVVSSDFPNQSSEAVMAAFRVANRAQLLDWVKANRYVREFSCAERATYNLETCDAQTLALTPTAPPDTAPIQADAPLNVRVTPNDSARIVATVRPGTQVIVVTVFNEWAKIRLTDGKEGWVRRQFIGR